MNHPNSRPHRTVLEEGSGDGEETIDIKAYMFLLVLVPENKFSNVRWDAFLGGDFCSVGLSFVKQYKVLCVYIIVLKKNPTTPWVVFPVD